MPIVPPANDLCNKPSGTPPHVIQISAAFDATMATMSDGTARCWGTNNANQCAIGDSPEAQTPTVSNGISCADATMINGPVSGALRADGSLLVWSTNAYGELGPTGRTDIPPGAPTMIPGLPKVTQFSANNGAVYVVTQDGQVFWWGTLPHPNTGFTLSLTPEPYPGLSNIRFVTHTSHVCALDNDGAVWCFGFNRYGQLGDGTTTDRLDPRIVPGIGPASRIQAGLAHSCALLLDGTVWCWGANPSGELGRGFITKGEAGTSEVALPSPAPVVDLPPSKEIALGDSTSCAITNDDQVYCWGLDDSWSFGTENAGAFSSPTHLPGLDGAAQLAVADSHICALKNDGTVWCQGELQTLGTGTAEPFPLAQVPFDSAVMP